MIASRIRPALAASFVLLATAAAVATTGGIRDAKVGVYERYGPAKMNVRLDKIERVQHVDSGPFAHDNDPNDHTKGYIVLWFSIQNAGDPGQIPALSVTSIYDDESQVEGHAIGPFIGSGRAWAPQNLESKQTVHEHLILNAVPAERTLTKLILDPSDGAPKLRFTIRPSDVKMLPDGPTS